MNGKIKSGILYGEDGSVLARMEGSFCTRVKHILSPEGKLLLLTDVCPESGGDRKGNVPAGHRYVMKTAAGELCAQAWPDYTPWESDGTGSPPLNRMPKITHARMVMNRRNYMLIMQSSRTYGLVSAAGKKTAQIDHCGIAGGWNINAWEDYLPAVLCGLFAFCRYLERENELMVV